MIIKHFNLEYLLSSVLEKCLFRTGVHKSQFRALGVSV